MMILRKLDRSQLEDLPIPGLLMLVGDEDKGGKVPALEILLEMGLQKTYPELDKALRDDDNADIRNGAMEVLVRTGSGAVSRLLRLLTDENEEVRNFATVMLGEIGSRNATVPLIGALRDPDANVRHGAAEALGRIGDRAALFPLIELLKQDFWQQFPAITALGEMRDERAVPHLLSLMGNEMLREPVITALGKIGDPRAILPLLEILADDPAPWTSSAARALVAIQNGRDDSFIYKNRLVDYGETIPLSKLINHRAVSNLKEMLRTCEDRETVSAAITLLGWSGDLTSLEEFFRFIERDEFIDDIDKAVIAVGRRAVPLLCRMLEHESDSIVALSLRCLRWLGTTIPAPNLLELMRERNEQVRVEAIESVKGMGDAVFLPLFRELLERGTEAVRRQVREALGAFPPAVVLPIIDDLRNGADPAWRYSAANLLGIVDGVDVATIMALLRDPAPGVRKEAVIAVGRKRLASFSPTIVDAMNDPDMSVREAAVDALSDLGDPDHLPELIRHLGSCSESLDFAIIRTIGRIGAPDAGGILVEYLRTKNCSRRLEFAIIETLGRLAVQGEAERAVIMEYIVHADPDIRRLAVATLARIAGHEAFPTLCRACEDTHWSVRIAAVQELGKMGGEAVVDPLLKRLFDDDAMVRKHAVLTLGDLGNVRTIPHLVRELADHEVSRHAFDALLKFGKTALPWFHRVIKGNYTLEVRERVIDLLGKVGSSKSVGPLLEMLEEDHTGIRLAAIDSLVFCFDSLPLKRLSQVKNHDPAGDVREKAELALKTLLVEKFF